MGKFDFALQRSNMNPAQTYSLFLHNKILFGKRYNWEEANILIIKTESMLL